MPSDDTPAALDDIRVLDLAGEIGQYCTKLLADLGADVIKIEPPAGDPARNLPPFYHDEPGHEKSLYWLNLNTSKRAVTLNIEDADGRRLFEKLAATADVVVESFEPGYLDRLGLGYEGLTLIKPDLILTSVTGFGQTGRTPSTRRRTSSAWPWAARCGWPGTLRTRRTSCPAGRATSPPRSSPLSAP